MKYHCIMCIQMCASSSYSPFEWPITTKRSREAGADCKTSREFSPLSGQVWWPFVLFHDGVAWSVLTFDWHFFPRARSFKRDNLLSRRPFFYNKYFAARWNAWTVFFWVPSSSINTLIAVIMLQQHTKAWIWNTTPSLVSTYKTECSLKLINKLYIGILVYLVTYWVV